MFIIESVSTLGWVVSAIVVLVAVVLIFRMIYGEIWPFSILKTIAAAIFSLFAGLAFGGLVALMMSIVLPHEETITNPYNAPTGEFSTSNVKVDKNEMNKFIQESANIDHVSVKVSDDDSSNDTVEDARNGEIFEFTGINDSVKIDGSFYFTENTMEIIISDEKDLKDQITVSTNE